MKAKPVRMKDVMISKRGRITQKVDGLASWARILWTFRRERKAPASFGKPWKKKGQSPCFMEAAPRFPLTGMLF